MPGFPLAHFQLCVVMIFLVSVIIYRGIVSVVMYHTGNAILMTQAGNIANISSTLVNLVLILLMSQVYTSLAEKLTRWEMHRTQTLHEDAFTFKVFIFQFVNFYSSPFYVAFFKGRFVGYPGQYGTLLGLRNEECGPGGCLIELAQQLFIIMVGKQIISNVQEFIIPKLKAWRQKRKLARVRGAQISQEPPRWEEDYELIECEGLFEEYLEMVLQFGFITIFVAAFPLAPLFALLNNWVEIRLDAQKFVCEYRRPVAYRAQNIGVWFFILEVLAQTSVIVNAFLIAFTSDFLPRLLYQYEHDSQLQGYVNFTLAYSPPRYLATGNHTLCRCQARGGGGRGDGSVGKGVGQHTGLGRGQGAAAFKTLLSPAEQNQAHFPRLPWGWVWSCSPPGNCGGLGEMRWVGLSPVPKGQLPERLCPPWHQLATH
uniref:Anoctamin n=1 Tax=Gopherus evgoodei TaxID=1825980 RepID=A0A8C4YMA2_9SAUR